MWMTPLPALLTRAMNSSKPREYVVFSANEVTARSVTCCASAAPDIPATPSIVKAAGKAKEENEKNAGTLRIYLSLCGAGVCRAIMMHRHLRP